MAPKPSSATSTNTAAAIRHRGTGFMLSLQSIAQRATARKRGWWGRRFRRRFRLPTAQVRLRLFAKLVLGEHASDGILNQPGGLLGAHQELARESACHSVCELSLDPEDTPDRVGRSLTESE